MDLVEKVARGICREFIRIALHPQPENGEAWFERKIDLEWKAHTAQARVASIISFEKTLELLDELRNTPTKRTWDAHFASALEAEIRELRSLLPEEPTR
jgi:hypothetical protein